MGRRCFIVEQEHDVTTPYKLNRLGLGLKKKSVIKDVYDNWENLKIIEHFMELNISFSWCDNDIMII